MILSETTKIVHNALLMQTNLSIAFVILYLFAMPLELLWNDLKEHTFVVNNIQNHAFSEIDAIEAL